MAEAHMAQGALAHLGLQARIVEMPVDVGIQMAEAPMQGHLALRGEGEDPELLAAVGAVIGIDLPVKPNTTQRGGGTTALWLGPNEWLLVVPGEADAIAAELSSAMSGILHAVNNVSDSRTALLLTGNSARDLLAKGTSLDVHSSVFKPGDCAQSTLALTHMLLHQLAEAEAGGPVYEIYVHRSFADYAWRWLERAAAEYGFAVVDGKKLMQSL